MKNKIFLLMLIISITGFAQQKGNVKKDGGSEKFNQELKSYPAPLTPILPEYPKVAKLAGIQGKVYVEVFIDEKGNVTETKIIKSDHETLNFMAMDAIKKTKFTPGISKENKKVKCKVVVPINFKLDEKPKVPDVGVTPEPPGEISDPDINGFVEVEKMPALIEAGKPVYPEEAKKSNVTGKTFVKVLIGKDGVPKKAIVIKSDSELFNQPAIDAAMKSKFSPALQKGNPVAVWVVLPYNFTLDGKEPKHSYEEYSTMEEARAAYKRMTFLLTDPEELKKIGNAPGFKQKPEKQETDINFGDESMLYKMQSKDRSVYGFFARDGKRIYKCSGETLDEIRKHVEGFRETKK